MKMALKIGGTTVVDNDKKLTQITGIDATTKTSLEAALTGIDADTLDGQQGSYYTTYTDNAISALVDSSPATLDTLNELAAALGDDPNFATTVSNQIGTKANSSITISAGAGLSGGGNLTASRTISHADTSSQASVNNSNGTVIQDVTLDGYGHVTGLASVNLDGRYYTETEADNRFVNVTGDTMTGNLEIQGNVPKLILSDTNNSHGGGAQLGIELDTTGGVQGFIGQPSSSDNTIYITNKNESVNALTAIVNTGGGDIVLEPDSGSAYVSSNKIFHDGYHPNADKWTTARTLSLTGAVTGSVSIDGSGNVSLATTATSDPTLTITGDANGSATFTNLGNATLNLAIDSDFQRVSDKEFFSITNTGTTSGVWTGTHPDVTSYFDGMTIAFYQNGIAGASTTTLNINNLGAKIIYYANDSKLTTQYGTRALIMLQYDAEQDRFYAHDFYFSSTDYELRWQTDIQAGTYIHGYQLLLEGVDGKYYPVTEGGSTGNTNTVSTAEIRVGGNMIKYNHYTDYAADAIITGNYLYTSLQTGNMEYWNNRDSGWATPYNPIYLVGTINSNGNFVLDNSSYTSFLTQDLPTTEDGKVYWYIGVMTDTYDAYRLIANHPMYIYKDGAVREWGQYASNSDRLDGQEGSYYYPASNPNGYTSNIGDITGVTAGSGISGGGTSGTVTISHADTSSQASVNNSNGTVIQDVTLDTYGHVTGLTSINLDGRYYTESEADSRFVNVTGDTLTGTLNYRMLSNQTSSNLDTAGDSSGFSVFYGTSSATSKPSGTDHAVATFSYSADWQTQLAMDWRTKNMYFRTQENGTWKSWSKMWHDANDGSGSGLDADLLDGQHGSYYYSAGNPPPYPAETDTLQSVTNRGNTTTTQIVAASFKTGSWTIDQNASGDLEFIYA
jgi:hypothetical protein